MSDVNFTHKIGTTKLSKRDTWVAETTIALKNPDGSPIIGSQAGLTGSDADREMVLVVSTTKYNEGLKTHFSVHFDAQQNGYVSSLHRVFTDFSTRTPPIQGRATAKTVETIHASDLSAYLPEVLTNVAKHYNMEVK